MAHLLDEPVPEAIDEKKHMLLNNHIAIWDVIQSCDIKGSSDSSIKNVEPTDIRTVSYTHLDVYKRQGLHHQRLGDG